MDSAEDVKPLDVGEPDNVIRFDRDGLPPPPPEFGTVLPAPPPSHAEIAAVTSGRRNRTTLIVAVASIVAISIGVGFALGLSADEVDPTTGLGSGEPQLVAAVVPGEPEGPVAEAAVAPVAAESGPRCPAGMVFVQGGKFFMGTDVKDRALASAQPSHQVSVESFCIDRTEVTLGAYRECSDVGECKRAYRDSWWPQESSDRESWEKAREEHSVLCNESYEDRDNHPVNCVTWRQAKSFCLWRGARLPTETQWEFAARGTRGRTYPWGDAAPDSEHMNACGTECSAWAEERGLPKSKTLYEENDGFEGTAPVGSFPSGKTSSGLADMAGNVFEWTADDLVAYPGGKPLEAEDMRVVRGGAFNSFMAQHANPALRYGESPNAHTDAIGFRCVTEPRN